MNKPKNRELKETLKEAIIEVFETRRDLMVDSMNEAMEDIGMLIAIREGDKNDLVKEEVLMNYLNKKISRKEHQTNSSQGHQVKL